MPVDKPGNGAEPSGTNEEDRNFLLRRSESSSGTVSTPGIWAGAGIEPEIADAGVLPFPVGCSVKRKAIVHTSCVEVTKV